MTPSQSPNPIINLIPLIMIFFIFYFLLIKPQKTKQSEQKKLIDNLKKNDEVLTAGGIHGTVVNVKDKSVVLRIDDNVKVEVEKPYIVALIKNSVAGKEEKNV